ncbi:hypothetical protein BGZ76_009753 [Entomortierella beljakovae]|nr:hypothetical protein BGZ76_009753 [Entomortierella beljakovae]
MDFVSTQELESGDTSAFMVQSPVTTSTMNSFQQSVSTELHVAVSAVSTEPSSTQTEEQKHDSSPAVKETLNAQIARNAEGHLILKNQYLLKNVIGQGAYGIVNLGEDVHNPSVKYAIKEFSKAKLSKKERASAFRFGQGRGKPSVANSSNSSPLDLIKSEIAILKKLNHRNIVKLYEVLDVAHSDSMYMVFELCELGVLTDVTLSDTPGKIFEDQECRNVFQQMILGIEYLHEHDIIHRDIKPDNLLRSANGTLKIVDFGVSEMFSRKGDDLIKKSAGSPAFMAPEWLQSDHGELSGKPADVWSMGVTLYCMKYGRLPFKTKNFAELNKLICTAEPDLSDEADDRFKNLMLRLLEKEPDERITINELRSDSWVTNDGKMPLQDKDENIRTAVVNITQDEYQQAIQSINFLQTVFKAVYKFKRLLKRRRARQLEEAKAAAAAAEKGLNVEKSSINHQETSVHSYLSKDHSMVVETEP